jgi:superfamily II DNA or RNA helicase
METILTIHNDYSYLLTKQEIKNFIWSKLRFRQKNYFHTRAYQNGTWDGYIDFFNKKTGKFLSGLLPEVEFTLNKLNVPYEKKDEREILQFQYQTIDENFLHQWTPKGESPKTLFDYQVELVNKAIEFKRGIVKSPTGSGKTLIFIAIMKALPPNTPTLFLVNRKTLVTQNYKEMVKWGIPNVGRFNSDHHEPNIITCANVQSIKHLEKHLPKFKVLVTDEIHMMSNASAAKAFRKMTGASIRIAVSATPFKFGETDKVQKYTVKAHFGPTLKSKIELTTTALQERGNLSDSRCTFYPIDEPHIPYHLLIDAIEHGIAKNTHYHKIVSRLDATLKGRTLILVDRVAHGDALSNLIPNSIWVSGKDNEKTREAVIEKLQKSKTKVTGIATRQIFDTGINFFIHNLIDCTDSSAEHLIEQIIGRGLRPCDDKEILNYYGFLLRMNPYLHDHSNDKIKILKKKGHEVIVKDSIDF